MSHALADIAAIGLAARNQNIINMNDEFVTQKADCGGVVVTRRLRDGHVDVRICYPREVIRLCADSPFAILPPNNIRQIVFEMSELLVTFPRRYRSPTSAYGLTAGRLLHPFSSSLLTPAH